MLDLSPETEDLARRLAHTSKQSVDQTVRDALHVRELTVLKRRRKDMSFEAIAARIATTDKIVAEVAMLPILDPRPVHEIVDDINEI